MNDKTAKNYFKVSEFKCKCCGKFIVNGNLINRLNIAREIYGRPMIVNSGYRCKKHNEEVGGEEDSAHLSGHAADIKCDNSVDRLKMLEAFIEAGFKRIGIAKTFIHVDVSLVLPQRVCWVY